MIIFLGALLLLVTIVLIVIFASRGKMDYDEFDLSTWRDSWQKIKQLAKSQDEFAQRQAVIEADNLFDRLLKHKGIGGSTLGERLKIIQGRYPALRQVWPAHLLRNRLVHESNYKLKNNEAERAIKSFAQAMNELGLNLD